MMDVPIFRVDGWPLPMIILTGWITFFRDRLFHNSFFIPLPSTTLNSQQRVMESRWVKVMLGFNFIAVDGLGVRVILGINFTAVDV